MARTDQAFQDAMNQSGYGMGSGHSGPGGQAGSNNYGQGYGNGTGNMAIPGQQQSGNMVDQHNQTFWGGGATPTGMQVNVGNASQSAGVNGIDPTANGYNQSLAAQYAAQAQGKGPSLAQMQLQQATDANARAGLSMAATGRNPALGAYNAGQNAAGANQQAAGQSAMARLQEQYQAQQGLAGLTNQMQNAYGFNAQLGQQNNQFNAGAQNSNQQLQANINAQQNQAYNGMMAGQQQQYNAYQQQHDLNEQQANNDARNGLISKGVDFLGGAVSALSDENQKTGIQPGGSELQSFMDRLKVSPFSSSGGGGQSGGSDMSKNGQGFAQHLQQRLGGGTTPAAAPGAASGAAPMPQFSSGGMGENGPMMSSAMPAAGGFGEGNGALASGIAGTASSAPLGSMMIAASDRRMKTGVKDGGGATGSFLDKLKAHEYRYKNPEMPGAGEGQHFSVMAQELEKAGPVGESMVDDTPNGKMVNYGKGFAAMLAAQADLHHRVKALEQSKGVR